MVTFCVCLSIIPHKSNATWAPVCPMTKCCSSFGTRTICQFIGKLTARWRADTCKPIPFISFLPIDSYDTRGAHAGTPSHWRDEEVLEDRAVFRTHKEPAELIINPVKVGSPQSARRQAPKLKCQQYRAFYNWIFVASNRKRMRETFAVAWTSSYRRPGTATSIWKLLVRMTFWFIFGARQKCLYHIRSLAFPPWICKEMGNFVKGGEWVEICRMSNTLTYFIIC